MVLFFTYNDNIPAANNNPSDDQPNMQTNTNSINSIIAVDHYPFETNFDGTHKQVQIKETAGGNGTLPAGLQGATFETLYSSVTGGVGDLWFARGAGAGIRLTGPGTPVATLNGMTFLPGGLVMKWGYVNIGNGFQNKTAAVLFPVAFPNNCFSVQLTLEAKDNTVTSGTNTLAVVNFISTAFSYVYNGSSSSNYPNFYYLAIGN